MVDLFLLDITSDWSWWCELHQPLADHEPKVHLETALGWALLESANKKLWIQNFEIFIHKPSPCHHVRKPK